MRKYGQEHSGAFLTHCDSDFFSATLY